MCVSEDTQRGGVRQKKYLAIIGGLLSTFQMILTLAIVGCEVGNSLVQFQRMNAFVGYWVFPFFMCAWISLAGASCCCRARCCGITTLVFQCLAILFALCVIGFNAYFLNNPTQCFFSNSPAILNNPAVSIFVNPEAPQYPNPVYTVENPTVVPYIVAAPVETRSTSMAPRTQLTCYKCGFQFQIAT